MGLQRSLSEADMAPPCNGKALGRNLSYRRSSVVELWQRCAGLGPQASGLVTRFLVSCAGGRDGFYQTLAARGRRLSLWPRRLAMAVSLRARAEPSASQAGRPRDGSNRRVDGPLRSRSALARTHIVVC